MNEIIRVFRTLWAYLKRTELYPELSRKIVKNTIRRKNANKGQEISLQWAQNQAISTSDFIENHLSIKNYKSFDELFPKDFAYALQEQENCPIKMGGAADLDLLYWIAKSINAQYVVETGVAYGWSSLALLEEIATQNGKLYSSDMPYIAQNGDEYVGCVVPKNLQKYWEIFRYADREALVKIFETRKEFDLGHYDSDKSYDGMLWGYQQIFPKIVNGGYFISDDIGDNSAFKDFCEQRNLKPIIVSFEGKYIGIIQK